MEQASRNDSLVSGTPRTRSARSESCAAALIFAACALWTYPAVLRGGAILPVDWLYEAFYPWRALKPGVESLNPHQNDAIAQLLPLDLYTRERLRAFEAPLWNPYLGAGIPHLATGFSRALYPVFWPSLLLSPAGGRNLEILTHLVLGALFMFLYLRRMETGFAAAVLGGLAFAWSGALTLRTSLSYVADTLTWLPLLLYAVEGVLKDKKRSSAVLALATGLQLLAGSLPDVLSSWCFLGFYALGHLLGRPLSVWRRSAGRIVSAAVLGAGLAAVQLLPHAELVTESHRGARTYSALAATGAPLSSLLTALSPEWLGSTRQRGEVASPPPPGSQSYVGIVSLVFLGVGLLRPVDALARRKMLFAGGGVFLIASGSPLLFLLYVAVPPVAGLRYVDTFANVCPAAWAGVAAWGAHAVLARQGPAPRLALRLACALGLILGVAGLVLRSLGGSGFRHASAQALLAAGWMIPLVGLLVFRDHVRPFVFSLVLITLSASDLVRFPQRENPVSNLHEFPLFPPTPGLEKLKDGGDLYRVLAVAPEGGGDTGPWAPGPNLLMSYHVPEAGAYHSLLPARLNRYYTLMGRLSEGVPPGRVRDSGRSLFNVLESYDFRPSILARLMNVRYAVYSPEVKGPCPEGLRLAYSNELKICEVVKPLPRVLVVPEHELYGRPEQVLVRMLAADFDPERLVLLEGELPPIPPTTRGGVAGSAEVVLDKPERVTLRVLSPTAGFVMLCDEYFPGWAVRVNGQAAKLLRADYLFRAVRVPAGTSTVEFVYAPRSLLYGATLSLASAGLLGILFLAARPEATRTPPVPPATRSGTPPSCFGGGT